MHTEILLEHFLVNSNVINLPKLGILVKILLVFACAITIRYVFLSTHYRKPLDYSQKALDDAKKALKKFHGLIPDEVYKAYMASRPEIKDMSSKMLDEVINMLKSDLNLAKVIAYLHGAVKEVGAGGEDLQRDFIEVLDFLGLFDESYFEDVDVVDGDIDAALIEKKIALRKQAKADRDFALADQIRGELTAMGIVIKDEPGGEVSWEVV